MKKILALAVVMLLVPFTAFGMQMMSDSDMDSITGQSGVAISLSNIQIYSDGGGDLWYETTVLADAQAGTDESTQAVGILSSGTESFTFINAIADPSQFFDDVGNSDTAAFPDGIDTGSGVYNTALIDSTDDSTLGNLMLRGDYSGFSNIFSGAADGADYGVRLDAAVLSIRVVDNWNSVFKGKASADTDVNTDDAADFASVEIGLPTLEIYNPKGSVDAMQIVMWGGYDSVDSNPLSDWDNLASDAAERHTFSLGTIYTGGESTTAILGGRVGITTYGQIDEAYKTYGGTESTLP